MRLKKGKASSTSSIFVPSFPRACLCLRTAPAACYCERLHAAFQHTVLKSSFMHRTEALERLYPFLSCPQELS
jgi:hypothetical protein